MLKAIHQTDNKKMWKSTLIFSGRLSLELCENEHVEGNQKKPQDFGHKKKIHLHPTLAAGLMEKKKIRHFLLHTWHYTKLCVRTALPLDSQRVLKYVWSWQAMESWSPTSQYDDSLNVLPKIVKFTQESSFTELLTCSSTVTRLTAHRWSVTLSNLQAYRVSPCTENARRKTYSVPNKSYTLALAKIVSSFFSFPVWNKYGCFSLFIYYSSYHQYYDTKQYTSKI